MRTLSSFRLCLSSWDMGITSILSVRPDDIFLS